MVFLLGCSHLGVFSKSIDLKNDIALNVVSPQMHYLRIYKMDDFIYVSGTVNKTGGRDLARQEVNLKFLNSRGDILVGIQEPIYPRRTHLHRGTTGRFVARIPYDPDIKTCRLEVKL